MKNTITAHVLAISCLYIFVFISACDKNPTDANKAPVINGITATLIYPGYGQRVNVHVDVDYNCGIGCDNNSGEVQVDDVLVDTP